MVKQWPIPLSLLIHDITVTEAQESQASSLHSHKAKQHVFEHVRVQPKDMASQAGTGAQNKGSYLVFIDYHNSINEDDYLIKEGDRVLWNGVNRKVMGNSPLYALDTEHVHHWEVTLE